MSRVSFAQPDVTLTLDLDGIIRRAVFAGTLSSSPHTHGIDWVGRPWADTVASGRMAQVGRMLHDARTAGVSPFQELRQRFPSGEEIAVEYTTVRLGGDAGLLAIGRSLEAVAEVRSRLVDARVSMERDSWKMRGIELRYRQLFDAAEQPVLLLDAADLRVVEVNAAGTQALRVESGDGLVGEIRESERASFEAMLGRVREQGKAPAVVIHVRADRTPWLVRASYVPGEPSAVFLLQLSPSGAAPYLVSSGATKARSAVPGEEYPLHDLVARLPEPFVVLGAEGKIVRANGAFLALVEVTSEARVLGRPLDQWVVTHPSSSAPFSAVSVGAVVRELERVPAVREHTVTIKGELGKLSHVAIAAAGNADGKPRFVGLLLRQLDKASQRAVVRASISSIERQCLEAVERLTKRPPREKT